MWRVKQARGQFQRLNPSLETTMAATSETAMASVTRVLGAATPNGLRGNFELLDEVMASVQVAGTGGGRTSAGTYCGLSSLPKTAESDAEPKGAWIAISPGYIALIERVAAIAVAFPRILREVFLVERNLGEYEALEMLGNIRSSAFHYWGMLWHEAEPEFDNPEVWEPFIGTGGCVAIARAAVVFTLLHELAHLTQGDSSSRIDRPLRDERAAQAQHVPAELWPALPAHRNELIADCAAVDIYANPTTLAEPLDTAMVGSMVATIVTALDGWNEDQAAPSETHPSPFLRLECLLVYWCAALGRAEEAGWSSLERPSPASLERFAQTWGMGGWAAGRYRDGRDRLGLFDDINNSWGFTLKASGHTGVFLNSHTPP